VAGKDKPYKVYRGGRVRGPIRPAPAERRREAPGGDGYERKFPQPVRPRRWRRWLLLVLPLLVVLLLLWGLLGYLALRRGVNEANDRLDERSKRALTPQDGSILSSPMNLLVLGADVGGRKDRPGRGRSDSITLIRTDPDEQRIAYLAIPRDLRVPIARGGEDKINAAYAIGGPALAIETVKALTGLDVNHVVVFDFVAFKDVVDALGGITIDNPKPILSNKFDCPYRGAEACATKFKGWRFRRGEIELDGRRALIYSRIRKNQLDPNESDITRGERQQRVIQGVADEVVSVSGFFRLPLIGDDIVQPIATDLSTGELLQLAWVKFRSADKKTLRCRLGGDPANVGGSAVLQPSEDNTLVIAMITGKTAAQRPPSGFPFAPGCFVGKAGG
jgi:polyisoprenyl-teichoic acid--peptidoglycan teichoic acid transferase